jgi:cytochrome c-type biogenesis protein CcmH
VLLWVVIALLTGAAVLVVVAPLAHAQAGGGEASEANIYRNQLEELAKDAELGRIGAGEAEAARAEIARRLFAAANDARAAPTMAGSLQARRVTAAAAIVALPLVSLGLYGAVGNPGLAGQPLAARLEAAPAHADMAALVAKVEAHLAESPQDGRGWDVIAPVYLSLGRANDAARAYRNAIRLLGATAGRQNGLGEALFMAAGGIVTAEARDAFAAASALEPAAPGPRFFLGLAAEQEGRPAEAAAIWRALLAAAGSEAGWRDVLEEALARVEEQPGPTEEEVAAAGEMTADERNAMIESMVASLAERLERDPSDVEGWLRLIRSYAVLGRDEEAAEAAAAALAGVADAAERARIEGLMAELGVAAQAEVR